MIHQYKKIKELVRRNKNYVYAKIPRYCDNLYDVSCILEKTDMILGEKKKFVDAKEISCKQKREHLIFLLALHLYKASYLLKKQWLFQRTPQDLFRLRRNDFPEFLTLNPKFLTFLQEREKYLDFAGKELDACDAKGYEVKGLFDADYPANLKAIDAPPLCLFVQGSFMDEDINAIAIVGSRKATRRGQKNAWDLARELASASIPIVSGLAIGVDAMAHRGALSVNGRTIAVLGCGLDYVYPRENGSLQKIIGTTGCVVSEYASGVSPLPYHFPVRNRLIAGLSMGVVFVEGGIVSGALHTTKHALNYGRDVFSYPGPAGDKEYQGNHKLLKEGAILTESSADVLSSVSDIMCVPNMSLPFSERQTPFLENEHSQEKMDNVGKYQDALMDSWIQSLNMDKAKVARCLLDGIDSMDKIVETSGLSSSYVLSTLSLFALEGRCEQKGNYFFLKKMHQ